MNRKVQFRFSPAIPVVTTVFLLLWVVSPVWAAPSSKEVEVVNSATEPVPVYDVDASTAQPVHDECVGTIPDGTAVSGDVVPAIPCLSELVPAGKRLVIEFVTVEIILPTGQRPGLLIGTSTQGFPSGTSAVDHEIALGVAPGFNSDIYTASVPVKLYSDPLSEVQIIVSRDQTAGSLIFDVTWSGYLLDAD